MRLVQDLAALAAIYDRPPVEGAMIKVTPRLTAPYAAWIGAARFCILTTVGPEGTDGSPRGDDGPVVRVVDDRTLHLPDWRGNNRIDSLRNIVRDGRVSLLFMVPGSANVMRVNGRAVLTDDPAILAGFDRDGTLPRTVIVVTVAEVYPQCARAIMRAQLWRGTDDSAGLPSVGQMIAAIRSDFDGAAYDTAWPDRAARTMW